MTFRDRAILYAACRDLSWGYLPLIMRLDSPRPLTTTACVIAESMKRSNEAAVESAPLAHLLGFPGLATIRRLSARHFRAVPNHPLFIIVRHPDLAPGVRRQHPTEAP